MDYKMNKRFLSLFNFILILLVFSSCHSQRVEKKKPIKLMGADYVLKQMHENQSTFTWFNGKAKVDFTDGDKRTVFTAQLRMKRDSAIWISLSNGIGIEGARFLLTQDSVKYINRIDKTFFVGDYEYLSGLIDTHIDFNMIQSLLTAKDFSWYDYQNLKAKLDNQSYQLESNNRHKLKKHSKLPNLENPIYYQSLWVNPETYKIERVKIKEIGNENNRIFASYDHYKAINKQLIPHTMDFGLDNEKGINLELVYSKISLDEEVGFPFSISKKYASVQL